VSGQANGFYISSKSWITITGFSIINRSDYGIAVSNSSHITLRTAGELLRAAGQRTDEVRDPLHTTSLTR